METKKLLVSFVTILALAVMLVQSVSAFSHITSVEVNGVEALSGAEIADFAGQTLPVRIVFQAYDDASDVRIKAWISGEKEYAVSTDRFDVIAGRTYSRLISVELPKKIDPSEDLKLIVLVESKNNGVSDVAEIELTVQRESYDIEILDVAMSNEVKAGSNLVIDVVLKNTGRKMAEDSFVKARIPALGIETKAYFGDLSAVDQANPDKEDAVQRRLFLSVPSNAPAGIYVVELEAYNSDSSALVTKKVAITGGAVESSQVVSSTSSRTFAVGERAGYTLTLVNTGNQIRVYELVPETPSDLKLNLADSVVAVPAGESKTVSFEAVATKQGRYAFAVNVYTDNELVKRYNFVAIAEGSGSATKYTNTTVLITVVLAIIFVVLLVVLIVLLTRKPEKSEEFGESYY
ncbi:MAG: hypothetical protein N3D20_01680 [Candidatus Pacearchaeota archaeon]|nr:hypothetical protein [Candidatus Pacearchaeota archaeon]